MPLDRAHVTIAARIMLPTYTLLNTVFAAAFLLDPQQRLALAPSLDAARGWMPIDRWGLIWFALALTMGAALVIRHRASFIGALGINFAVWLSWGFVVEAAVLTQPNVSYLAGIPAWFVAASSLASLLSLLAKER